jgi:lycopene beta-cyclase
LVILGAGCAGLTLANELLAAGDGSQQILLLEARAEYRNDRTWCYWDVAPHRFQHAVSRSWREWEVVHHRDVARCSGSYRYQHLRSADFYDAALRPVHAAENLTLKLGTDVRAVAESAEGVTIQTNRGTFRGARVIDTRPLHFHAMQAQPPQVHWFQHFAGWRIRTPRPAFSTERVTLMEFLDVAPQPRFRSSVPFLYVLPFAEDEALLEVTWFGPEVWEAQEYEAQLAERLRARVGNNYEIIERERGILPMSTVPLERRPSPRSVRLGLGGGAARPSTGYAFLAIQRQAQQWAPALLRHDWDALAEPYSSSVKWLDETFLNVLAQNPQRAPELFLRMFRHADADALVRFLSDAATPPDLWNVMRTLPTQPFAKQSLQNLMQRWLGSNTTSPAATASF